MASPGRSPLETARLAIGARTEVDSTKAIAPGPVIAAATVRATRSPPTKTDWKLEVHTSSLISRAGPGGGPPTEISAPSSRPQVSFAASTTRVAVSVAALSPTTATADSPSSATAASRLSWLRPESTTRAPSATSRSAVARPRPRAPPVTTYTRSVSPRSIPPT